MNEHIELLVAVKQNPIMNILKIVLYVLTGCGVALALIGIFSVYPLIFAIITGFIAYFVGLRSSIEYEYTLTDKEIDIDVIYSKQSRKNITSIDLTQLEIMAPIDSSKLDSYKGRNSANEDYSSHNRDNNKNIYVMYCEGSRRIVIEPDDRLYKAIYNVAPHKVYNS